MPLTTTAALLLVALPTGSGYLGLVVHQTPDCRALRSELRVAKGSVLNVACRAPGREPVFLSCPADTDGWESPAVNLWLRGSPAQPCPK